MDSKDITKVNGIWGKTKPKGIGTIMLELKENNGNIHKLKLENFCYLPEAPNILVNTHKWATTEDKTESTRN